MKDIKTIISINYGKPVVSVSQCVSLSIFIMKVGRFGGYGTIANDI